MEDRTSEKLSKELLDGILAANMRTATSAVDSWIESRGYEDAITELIEPVLSRIGKMWEAGEGLSLAQGYMAAKVVEKVLIGRIESVSTSPRAMEPKGPVVIGNVEDDFHFLGRKMVVAFLRSAGWRVVDLGNDVPPAEFVDTAVEVGAKVIGVSAMTYTNARNIVHLREEIDGRNLRDRMQLAVGGAVFVLRPGLVKEVGGDGTAVNGIVAPQLFDELWKQAVEAGHDLDRAVMLEKAP